MTIDRKQLMNMNRSQTELHVACLEHVETNGKIDGSMHIKVEKTTVRKSRTDIQFIPKLALLE